MERADLLLTMAQLGIAMSGFAGLVTLLGHGDVSGDQRLNELRFRSMVELGLFLVVFALLPFVPSGLGLDGPRLWRACSDVYALAALAFLFLGYRRNRRVMGRALVAGRATAIVFAAGGGVVLLLAAGALGALPGREDGAYCAALFVHFCAAAFFFIRLLYATFPHRG